MLFRFLIVLFSCLRAWLLGHMPQPPRPYWPRAAARRVAARRAAAVTNIRIECSDDTCLCGLSRGRRERSFTPESLYSGAGPQAHFSSESQLWCQCQCLDSLTEFKVWVAESMWKLAEVPGAQARAIGAAVFHRQTPSQAFPEYSFDTTGK